MAEDAAPTHRRWGNRFGLLEAVIGFLAGELIGSLFSALSSSIAGHHTNLGADAGGLVGLWFGLLGAVFAASLGRGRSQEDDGRPEQLSLLGRLRRDYGLAIAPMDAPLGIVVGLISSFALVPLLTLPLEPFVPHLSQKLQQPANQLANHINGGGYVVLALLVCVGSPVVEELFFRGLVLRALLGRLGSEGLAGPIASVVITGILFGLAHFEAYELLALAGFGMVLSVLALRTGRLAPGMFAHATFNAVTIISLAHNH